MTARSSACRARRAGSATCAATERSRTPPATRWPTPSCAATSATPPRPSAPSGPRSSPSCPTGRSCATPARRSRPTTMARLRRAPGAAGGAGHRPRRHRALGARRQRGQRDRHRPGAGDRRRPRSSRSSRWPPRRSGSTRRWRRRASPRYETDLAELIVQLGHDKPSHILVPAIHRNRAEIREIFLREMPGVDPDLTDEPRRLAMAARAHLREKFLRAKVGDLRRQLRRRRDRHAAGGRVRGQRPDVPDAARDADHRHGHREGRADLAGPRGVPAAAAPLVDRRADEPLHLDVDRASRPATGRRSSTSCCSTTGARRRWPTRSGAMRCTASGARRA